MGSDVLRLEHFHGRPHGRWDGAQRTSGTEPMALGTRRVPCSAAHIPGSCHPPWPPLSQDRGTAEGLGCPDLRGPSASARRGWASLGAAGGGGRSRGQAASSQPAQPCCKVLTHTEHSLSPRTLLAPSSSCADILIVLLWELAGSLSSGAARRGARAGCWPRRLLREAAPILTA